MTIQPREQHQKDFLDSSYSISWAIFDY